MLPDGPRLVLQSSTHPQAVPHSPRLLRLLYGCVWCVLQAPLDSIKGTVNALGPVVDLAQVYGGLHTPAPYNLRWVRGRCQHTPKAAVMPSWPALHSGCWVPCCLCLPPAGINTL